MMFKVKSNDIQSKVKWFSKRKESQRILKVYSKDSQRIIKGWSRAGQRIVKGYSPGSSRKFEVLLLPEEPCVLDDLPPAKLFRLLIAKSVRVEVEGNFQSLEELLYPG